MPDSSATIIGTIMGKPECPSCSALTDLDTPSCAKNRPEDISGQVIPTRKPTKIVFRKSFSETGKRMHKMH